MGSRDSPISFGVWTRLEGLGRSFKFTSREHELILQEIEANSPKVPFAIEQPANVDVSEMIVRPTGER